jgi:hypothetical protein
MKELRRQLHPLIEEHTRKLGNAGTNTQNELVYAKSLNSRISTSLMDGRLDDSHQFLLDFKRTGQNIKLGTIQRWVRDINVNTVKPEPQKVRLLDLVLRCTPEFRNDYNLPPEEEHETGRGLIFKRDEWEPVPKQKNL